MIPIPTLERLAALDGRLTAAEGQRLAELASGVPLDQAIVEIGSYKGKSACYLGIGSRCGAGAPVYAIDLWDLHEWPEYSAPAVFATWRAQVASLGLSEAVTPIRGESGLLGRLFSLPIGLLFIDGNHGYQAVARDFHAWSQHVAPGGVVAFHDYGDPRFGADVRRFVDEQVLPSGRWTAGETTGSLYVAVAQRPAAAEPESLAFVSNDELREHLAQRPPQYAFDLALIVARRDEAGIYVNTHSPHYTALMAKYAHSRRPLPLFARVEAICRTCSVGAECRFARMSAANRQAALSPDRRGEWPNWCQAGAWGQEIDVVYPYIAGAAEGDELRYSLRSLERNLVARPRVWLVGDRPGWYRGCHLPHGRLAERPHRPRYDRAAKLWDVVRDRRIGREFVWMMDDVYLLAPVTLHELRQRYSSSDMDAAELAEFQPSNVWEHELLLTWQALHRAGRPVDDQAAHLPYVYEKDKLRKLFRKYKPLRQPYVDNVLYLNEYSTSVPRPCEEILYTEDGQPAADEIRRRLQPALIMNHAHRGFTPAMREVLQELFPEPSQWERTDLGSHVASR